MATWFSFERSTGPIADRDATFLKVFGKIAFSRTTLDFILPPLGMAIVIGADQDRSFRVLVARRWALIFAAQVSAMVITSAFAHDTLKRGPFTLKVGPYELFGTRIKEDTEKEHQH